MADNLNWPEGRLPPRSGKAALSRSVACQCGEWEFRDLTLTTALTALERYCPRCRSGVLIVFRGPEHIATAKLECRHPREVRVSLEATGLTETEIEQLMCAVLPDS